MNLSKALQHIDENFVDLDREHYLDHVGFIARVKGSITDPRRMDKINKRGVTFLFNNSTEHTF